MSQKVSTLNKTRGKLPSLPLLDIKNDILGKDYELSVVFVQPKLSQKLNKKYRRKDKSTNVLSFPLSKNSGELVLCPAVAKKESKNFEKNFREFLGFLVIHGMLHLKGMEHGSIMDRAEKKYDQKYFYRYRRGLPEDKSRGGRVYKRRKKS